MSKKEDRPYSQCPGSLSLDAQSIKRLEAEAKRNGVKHEIVLMDGSVHERRLTLIEVGSQRKLYLGCHVTGLLFDPNDGRCLSSTRIFARGA